MTTTQIKHLKKVKAQLLHMGYKPEELERYFSVPKPLAVKRKVKTTVVKEDEESKDK